MNMFLENSLFAGAAISLGSYAIGLWLRKKSGSSLCNPLLVSIVLTISFLLLTGTSYESYQQSTQIISYMLTPATVCLALPLYEQFEILRKHWQAVLAGILSGVVASLVCILLMALAFGFMHEEYVTFLPKSITTAIGMGVIEELGGHLSLGVVIIVITGVLGNVIAEAVLKLFKIEEPIAKGIAIGSASHAVGTARAMEIGRLEGAMSSLSIVVCGLLTVVLAPVFALFL